MRRAPNDATDERVVHLPWGIVVQATAVAWVLAGTLFGKFTTFIAFDHRAVGQAMLDQVFPYKDFAFEYPPGAAGILALPALAGRDAYDMVFRLLMAGLWIGMLLLMRAHMAAGIRGFLLGSVALTFVIGAGFDIVIAVVVMAAFLAFRSASSSAAGWWLGVGTIVKLVPSVLLPLIARGLPIRRVAGLTLIGSISLAIALGIPALLADKGHDPFGYHTQRMLHAESLIGSGIVLQRIATEDAYPIVFDHGSRSIEDADGARFASIALLTAALALLWLRARPDAPTTWAAVLLAIPALGPVASPQFLLWPLAFVGLLSRYARWSFVVAGALSALMFTGPYPGEGTMMAMLTAGRNITLLAAFGFSAWDAIRPAAHTRDGSGSDPVLTPEG